MTRVGWQLVAHLLGNILDKHHFLFVDDVVNPVRVLIHQAPQRFRLQVGVAVRDRLAGLVEHGADLLQALPVLSQPGGNGVPQGVDGHFLQARPLPDALPGEPGEIMQMRPRILPVEDVWIPGLPR